MLFPSQVFHHCDDLGARQVCTTLHLQKRIRLAFGTRCCICQNLFRVCDSFQFGCTTSNCRLVISGNLHAIAISSSQGGLCVCKVLVRCSEITFGGCFGFQCGALCCLLFCQIVVVSFDGV